MPAVVTGGPVSQGDRGAPQGACHQLSTHRAFLSWVCGAAKNWQAFALDYLTLLVPELLAYASGMVAF